jgi:hypothetical protein
MPLPGFVTNAQLQTALENMIRVAAGTFSAGDSAYVLNIIADANKSAYQDIQAALLRRGLTQAQLDTWDRGGEYQKDIGLYWCLVKTVGLHAFDDKFCKALDRRGELKCVELYASGVPLILQTPPAEGQVTHGALDTTNDLFVPNANDPLRGQITRW